MSIYRMVADCIPKTEAQGYSVQLVDHVPTSASGLGNLSALIFIKPLRVDFSQGGTRDRHIGAVDVYSPLMATAWSIGLILAGRLREDCETTVYDLRPDQDKSGLLVASLKVSSLLEMERDLGLEHYGGDFYQP